MVSFATISQKGTDLEGIIAADGSVVSHNVMAQNGGSGFDSSYSGGDGGLVVTENVAYRNIGDGFNVLGSSVASHNAALGNTDSGLTAIGSVDSNAASMNGSAGISAEGASAVHGNAAEGNQVRDRGVWRDSGSKFRRLQRLLRPPGRRRRLTHRTAVTR